MIPVKRFCGAAAWAQLSPAMRDRVGALLLETIACARTAAMATSADLTALENICDEAQGGLLDRIDSELDALFEAEPLAGAVPMPSVFSGWCERLSACPQLSACAGGHRLSCAGRCGAARSAAARLDA